MSGQLEHGSKRASIVGAIGAFILGAVLIIATFGKVAEPIVFVEQIRNEGLDFLFSANTVALIALALEIWLGFALLLGDRSRWILYPTTLLVAFFLFITGRTYWLVVTGQIDNTYDCGCFGVFMERTVIEAFWQDLFLLVPPLLMCFAGRKPPTSSHWPSWRFWAGAIGAVIIVGYAVFGVGMPEKEPVVVDQTAEAAVDAGAFRLTEEYILLIGDAEDPTAQIFQSDVTLQFVVLSSQISSPLVLDLRRSQVLGVSPEMIVRKAENTLDLPSTSGAEELGSFEVGATGLSLTLNGQKLQIRSR